MRSRGDEEEGVVVVVVKGQVRFSYSTYCTSLLPSEHCLHTSYVCQASYSTVPTVERGRFLSVRIL
jgi:hypothetical protein